jgi:hypothetical protein
MLLDILKTQSPINVKSPIYINNWHMGFNSAFKFLMCDNYLACRKFTYLWNFKVTTIFTYEKTGLKRKLRISSQHIKVYSTRCLIYLNTIYYHLSRTKNRASFLYSRYGIMSLFHSWDYKFRLLNRVIVWSF